MRDIYIYRSKKKGKPAIWNGVEKNCVALFSFPSYKSSTTTILYFSPIKPASFL